MFLQWQHSSWSSIFSFRPVPDIIASHNSYIHQHIETLQQAFGSNLLAVWDSKMFQIFDQGLHCALTIPIHQLANLIIRAMKEQRTQEDRPSNGEKAH
jgi:hypothetical protein